MKTIIFKNGHSLEVTIQIANTLKDRMVDTCNEFQIFTKDNGTLYLMINVSDISLIK